ncbi:XrtA/PEP-CTERM system TPR-repeat protein PrsT [Duganella callida]|uniref:PEP-CTERM system TPR-repeat protein PrsT n=1 Tax=Duganella callida TaxID=2561932 RepID=A0A4Y9SAW7_9BURK|nr:XrtA/PEP-CTERM system TPR-repeat protein PrsT [Duganella callida]TFW19284.1 PEP-CTERM system TPR-repeat protein PrsT [Duganella callida]
MSQRVTRRAARTAVFIYSLVLAAGLTGCGKTETSASLLADAKQYLQKGDNKAALIQLKNAASKSPDDAEIRYRLASLHNKLGDGPSAEKEIRKAISLGYDQQATAPELVKALSAQGQFQKALDESAAALTRPTPGLLVARGDAFFALNQPDQALAAYRQALAAQAGSAGGLIGLARHAVINNDLSGAMAYLEQAQQANPQDPDVWYYKGTVLAYQGKRQDAVAAYAQVLALQPDNVRAMVERAHLHIDAGDFAAAKVDVDAARKIAPSAVLVMYTQALLDFKQGRYSAARDSLQKVLRVAPEHMLSILLSGAVEMNLGALAQAEQHLRKYLEQNPDNAYARKLLAQTLLKASQPAEAEAALAPLLKQPGKDADLLALAGQSSMQGQEFRKAAGYFADASKLQPDSAALHTSLGLSKVSAGDMQGIADLEAGAALAPKSTHATLALVQAEMNLKHYDKALAALQAFDQRQPGNPEIFNARGAIYQARGDLAQARGNYASAIAAKGDYFTAALNLAQLEMRAEQPEAAKKVLTAYLQRNPKARNAMQALAEIAMAQKQPEQATRWLEQAYAVDELAVPPALALGAHYLAIKQPQKALGLARKLQAANSADPAVIDLLGQAQLANNDAAAALESYSQLVKALPKSAEAQLRLARVHMLLKNDDAATEDLKRATALQPDWMPARMAQAEFFLSRGKINDALAAARQMQRIAPRLPAGYTVEGDIQAGAKHPELALPAYEKAYALDKQPQHLIRVANVLKFMGKTRDAETRLQQWHQGNPADPVVALYLAEHYINARQYPPAADVLRDMLKVNPKNPVALNNLAWVYQQTRDARALATAEQAAQLSPNNPSVMDTLGWLLLEQGDHARALALLQKAVGGAPQAPELRYHLAVALSKSGDKPGARKELEKVLAANSAFPQADEARSLLKSL